MTPGVVGETELEDGALIFPITGGMATLYEQGTTGSDPFIVGVIEHDEQGITLTAGGKDGRAQELRRRRRPVRDPHRHRGRRRESFADDVPTFIADGTNLEYPPTTEDGNAILEGTEVKLTAGAADALNSTFGVDAFTEGFPIGVAKIAVAAELVAPPHDARSARRGWARPTRASRRVRPDPSPSQRRLRP